jgi:hypothetical protein
MIVAAYLFIPPMAASRSASGRFKKLVVIPHKSMDKLIVTTIGPGVNKRANKPPLTSGGFAANLSKLRIKE